MAKKKKAAKRTAKKRGRGNGWPTKKKAMKKAAKRTAKKKA